MDPSTPKTPETPKPEEVEESTAASNGAADSSTMARLRRRRDELGRERKPLDKEIPGYGGELVAQYGVVEWLTLRKIAERGEKSSAPRKDLLVQADTLVNACLGIFVKVGTKLTPVSELLDDGNEEPVRYDERLGQFLGFESKSARQALFATFRNDLAVSIHHNEVAEWMADNDPTGDEDFSEN
jgi:hypothetical protein